eukprot:6172424-Pleurochrysis_carterae.AAC.3
MLVAACSATAILIVSDLLDHSAAHMQRCQMTFDVVVILANSWEAVQCLFYSYWGGLRANIGTSILYRTMDYDGRRAYCVLRRCHAARRAPAPPGAKTALPWWPDFDRESAHSEQDAKVSGR